MTIRPSIAAGAARSIGGVPILAYEAPRRVLPTATPTGTGSLKWYVEPTTPLTANEWNVARAFWVLFGRAPERSSMAYWVSQPYSNDFINTVDSIIAAISGSRVLDLDPTVAVTRFYYNIFGKYESEDASGIGYWAARVAGGDSLGFITNYILSIGANVSGFHGDTMRNRQLALESVIRLQAAYSRDLNYQDSRSLALAPDGTLVTYDSTMQRIYERLVLGTSPSATAWSDAWTSTSLYDASRIPDNSPVRQIRNVLWYNRHGEAMLANFYLPPDFVATAETRCIIAMHGGGWRIGAPYQLDWFCMAMAANAAPARQFVVIAPTYRLTAYGYTAPSEEEDLYDFTALVRFSDFLKGSTSQVGFFGESSGAHLCLMAGCLQSEWKVLGLYPPTDLRGTPSVSTGLQPYCDYYAPDATTKQNSSPMYKWNGALTTHFNLWHGSEDTFVPPSQSTNFAALVGATLATVTLRPGENHGFSPVSQAAVIDEAKVYFGS